MSQIQIQTIYQTNSGISLNSRFGDQQVYGLGLLLPGSKHLALS